MSKPTKGWRWARLAFWAIFILLVIVFISFFITIVMTEGQMHKEVANVYRYFMVALTGLLTPYTIQLAASIRHNAKQKKSRKNKCGK